MNSGFAESSPDPSPPVGEGVGRSPTDEGSRSASEPARPRKATVRQARSLRRRASSTEQLLWRLLRDRCLEGIKFRRQVPMGPYILDFVCFRHRLVVEADGPFHDAVHDAVRDAWLASRGLRVLRSTNALIQNDRDVVLERIMDAIGRPPLIIEV